MSANPNSIRVQFTGHLLSLYNASIGQTISRRGMGVSSQYVKSNESSSVIFRPNTCDIEIKSNMSVKFTIGGSKYDVDLSEVEIIKEEETGVVLWKKPSRTPIVMELKPKTKIKEKGLGFGVIVLEIDIGVNIFVGMVDMWDDSFGLIRFNIGVWAHAVQGKGVMFGLGNCFATVPFNYIRKVSQKYSHTIWQAATP